LTGNLDEMDQVLEDQADTVSGAEAQNLPPEAPANEDVLEEAVEHDDGRDEDSEDIVIAEAVTAAAPASDPLASLKAVIEAAIYITDEPLSAQQMATALQEPVETIQEILRQLVNEYAAPDRGLSIRELAGGYKMSTKAEHHESIRRFVNKLQPPLKLSLAALETLAVVAYKQPITAPEILDVRGVQGAGVLKTLLDRKLIAAAGRKNVVGKPILYKTTREFLIQFGLNSLAELPTLKEFEELGRFALSENEEAAPAETEAESSAPEEAIADAQEAEAQPGNDPEAALPEEQTSAAPATDLEEAPGKVERG